MIGQEEAVKQFPRQYAGRVAKDPNNLSVHSSSRTQVGKTELSKALAEVMFGDEESMIRIDMSIWKSTRFHD